MVSVVSAQAKCSMDMHMQIHMQALVKTDEHASALMSYLALAGTFVVSGVSIGIKTFIKSATAKEGQDSQTEVSNSLFTKVGVKRIRL